MMFNRRNILSAALISFCALRTTALDLEPILDPSDLISKHSKRDGPEGLTLIPIEDPGVFTHGRSLKRQSPGNDVFDPTSTNSFFWGAYAGNTIFLANFTLSNPDENEFILAIESFAKRLKSINCGSEAEPITIEFNDKASFSYAKSAWDWVNLEDDNKFTLVTEPNQCYEGDDRSPYLVHDISFDESKLVAKLFAKERPWGEIAHSFRLTLSHEFVDPDRANETHPHLMHMKRATKTLDISTSFSQNLFKYHKGETSGLDVTADASITTGGQIIADLDIEYKWFIPTDLKINIHPSGVNAQFLLSLQADGKLGTGLDWALKPEIEIPVGALNIKGILEIGPYVTMGVHVGSSALEGTATAKVGARATIDDSATVEVELRHPSENRISGWTPHFERIEPSFTAQIGGNVKAWAELGIQIKAEALGRWGYQASVDAQLPYFEAAFSAKIDTVNGVCGTTKPFGIDLGANVGINVNLNAGEVDEAPSFSKDLFQTSWNLFSTCIGIGPEGAPATATSTPVLALPTASSAEPTFTPPSSPLITPTPTSSIAIESSISSVVVEPSVSSAVVEPSISSAVVEPSISSAVVEPSISSAVVEPSITSAVVEPSISSAVEPESSLSLSSKPLPSTDSPASPSHIPSSYASLPSHVSSSSPHPIASSSAAYHNISAPHLPSSTAGYGSTPSASSSKPCSSTLKSVVKSKSSIPLPYTSSSSSPSASHYALPLTSAYVNTPAYGGASTSSKSSSTIAYPVHPAPSSSALPYVPAPVPSSSNIGYPVYDSPSSSSTPVPSSTVAYPVFTPPTSSAVPYVPPPAPSSSSIAYPIYTPPAPYVPPPVPSSPAYEPPAPPPPPPPSTPTVPAYVVPSLPPHYGPRPRPGYGRPDRYYV